MTDLSKQAKKTKAKKAKAKKVKKLKKLKKGEYSISAQGKKIVKRKCNATAKSTGLPCTSWAMDNGRCHLHGGANHIPDRPDKPNYKHGIYIDAILDNETELYKQIKNDINSFDEEIMITKLKLRRAYIAQHVWEEGVEDDAENSPRTGSPKMTVEPIMPPASVERDIGVSMNDEGRERKVNKLKVTRRARDFSDEIHVLTLDIIKLVRAKAELQLLTRGADFKEQLAKDLRNFSMFAGASIPEPMFDNGE